MSDIVNMASVLLQNYKNVSLLYSTVSNLRKFQVNEAVSLVNFINKTNVFKYTSDFISLLNPKSLPELLANPHSQSILKSVFDKAQKSFENIFLGMTTRYIAGQLAKIIVSQSILYGSYYIYQYHINSKALPVKAKSRQI